ncbi:MAG: hypothetical protein BV458_07350 [Thermoplasmata archaeon M9B2D]|nr:MAG: hypothetical protein BV458_07350 [Thermoplasmata archaeon M9B2D]
MTDIISKCGNLCSICPWGKWIRENQQPDEWEIFAEEVKKYVGYVPAKNPCQGCQTPDDKLAKNVGVHNFLRGCAARKCAFDNEIINCAYCSRYPCDQIDALNRGNRREEAEKRIGGPIPDDKYEAYVRVFEGKKTLDAVRSNLKPDEIQEVKTLELKPPRITPFPNITSKREELEYKTLHQVLSQIMNSKLGLKDADTLAGKELLDRRQNILNRLLWIAARYGELQGFHLSLDAITINTHKKGTSGFPTTESGWLRWLKIISEAGIKGKMEYANINKSDLISPIGWLRDRIPGTNDPAWWLKISFGDSLGGINTLRTLCSYASEIDERFGKQAYGRFKKADMRFLE